MAIGVNLRYLHRLGNRPLSHRSLEMKRLAVVLIVLGLAAGCNMQPVKEAKQDAYKRWYETRAQLLYGLAQDQYKAGELLKARSTANR